VTTTGENPDAGRAAAGGGRIRVGGVRDVPVVLALFDAAVRWLVAQGRTGQWGTEPFSTRPERVRQAHGWAAGGGLRIAEVGGEVAGAIVLGDAPSYAPPATEPELYVQAFVTDRERRGQGVGAALLERACAETVARGLRVLRLDCWGGGDRALVRYYERAGFTPTERFLVGAWEGQVLERRFPGPGPAA